MTNILKIQTLGPLELKLGEQPLALPASKKTRALIAILALEQSPQRREKLCDLLWQITDDPRGALRWSLSKLRTALGDDKEIIQTTRDTVTLDPTKIDLDWTRFSVSSDDWQNLSTPDLLKRTEEIKGAFLEDLSLSNCPEFDAWKLPKEEHVRRWRIDLMKYLLERDDLENEPALHTARALVNLAPEDEGAHRLLIERLKTAGHNQEAERQLEISRTQLKDLSEDTNVPLADESREGSFSPAPAKVTHTLDIPDEPRLAVLPFVDQPGAGENDYLALGMTEDITTLLSQVVNLTVISTHSTLSYADERPDIKTIGQELDVRYVVTGTVRRIGDNLRITVRLVDTTSLKNLWSDKQDRELSDIFDLQDELINGIVGSIGNEVVRAEATRAKQAPPDTLSAWGTVAKAMYYYYHGFSRGPVLRAITLCESAIKKMPDYAPAHSLLAFNLAMSVANAYTDSIDKTREAAIQAGRRALELEPDNPMVLCHWGAVNGYLDNLDLAIGVLPRALELNPNSLLALGQMGRVLIGLGRASEALDYIERAESLSPRDINAFARDLYRARAHLQLGDDQEAVTASEKSLASNNSWNLAWAVYALSLAAMGKDQKAMEAMQTARDLDQDVPKERYQQAIEYISGGNSEKLAQLQNHFDMCWQ